MALAGLSISGIQEAQAAVLRAFRASSPKHGLGRTLDAMGAAAHRFAVSITHVDTGALKASHLIKRESDTERIIYLNPGSRNPLTGARVIDYAAVEHARGAEHAFYERTKREGEPSIQLIGWATMKGQL